MSLLLVPQPSSTLFPYSTLFRSPHSTFLFVAQLIAGRVVSMTVTVWLQILLLLQASIAAHVRVAEKVLPQRPLVTVPRMTMRLVPQASAGAEGTSNVQAVPHSTF